MHIRSYLGVNFGAYEFALFALNFILKDGMIDGYFREWFLMPDIVEILCELFLVIE